MNNITPKEAIANLNHIYGMVSPDIQRSLDVAIKALERPSDDCISREALKTDLTSETRDKFEFVCLSRVLEKIDNAQTVPERDYSQGWHDAITKALNEAYTFTTDDGTFKVVQTETLEGLGMSIPKRPQGEWIPITEKLPNTLGVYNVTRKLSEGETIYFISDASYFDGQNTWYADTGINHGRPYLTDIIAWQPLPEPYKKGGAEE